MSLSVFEAAQQAAAAAGMHLQVVSAPSAAAAAAINQAMSQEPVERPQVHGSTGCLKMNKRHLKWLEKVKNDETQLSRHIVDEDMPVIIQALWHNPEITSVHLGDNNLGTAGVVQLMEVLKDLEAVTDLSLNDNALDVDSARAIADMLKVRTSYVQLFLPRNEFGVAGVQAIAEALKLNKTLTFLDLGCNAIGDDGTISLVHALRGHPTLKSLILLQNEISDAGVIVLADLLKQNKALKELVLSENEIGDAGAIALADMFKHNKSLTSLKLNKNKITEVGARAFSKALENVPSNELKYIELSYNIIGISEQEAKTKFGHRFFIDVQRDPATIYPPLRPELSPLIPEDVRQNLTPVQRKLLESLMEAGDTFAPRLRVFDDATARVFAEGLKVNTTRTKLDLMGTRFTATGLASLAEAIGVNKTLTELDMTNMNIDDTLALSVATILQTTTSLTEIRQVSLIDNQIGHVGAQAIGQALRHLKVPHLLNLSGNPLGDLGAAAIAEGLKENTALWRIELNDAEIGDSGAIALAEALKINLTTLSIMSLDQNHITEEGVSGLLDALRVHQKLWCLNLEENPLSEEVLKAFIARPIGDKRLWFVPDRGSNRWKSLVRHWNFAAQPQALTSPPALPIGNRLASFGSSDHKMLRNPEHTSLAATAPPTHEPLGSVFAEALTRFRRTARSLGNYVFSFVWRSDDQRAFYEALTPEQQFIYDLIKNGDNPGTGQPGCVSLSQMRIGNEGALTVAAALKVNKNVTKLDLYQNGIEAEGAKALAEALKVNNTLGELLSDNNIDDEGAIAIAEALRVNTGLVKLFMGDNRVEDAGAIAIAAAIRCNKSLRVLILSNICDPSWIRVQGWTALRQAELASGGRLRLESSDWDLIPADELRKM
ncbi:hypothetical protein CAOG_004610 [Capsaspora owczarzaki ATCC 30864]|uniref:NOD3 protein n=1 Tax=Capsaspora owczarzaki (strain ATCC 30864) TaxID=595528 RepID=A0A0D2VS70_CAPO3|nr:hypothetical protein CAOG_004610 [Capsaspora owczarzaki ATCC 30864]